VSLFQYQAIDKNGKSRKGAIEANDLHNAKEKLRDQGLLVASLEPKIVRFWERQNLPSETLTTFTLQLSQLIRAGLPLYESLLTLEEQYRGERAHSLILSLVERVRAGSSLSEAMGGYPDSFDRLYVAMVMAGEASGALDVVLERLSQFLLKQEKLRKQIVTAMLYPSVLSAFCLLVIGLLLGFVIPSLEGIFVGRELNGYTRFIISLSHFFNDYGLFCMPLIIGGGAYGYYLSQTPPGRRFRERWSLKVPVVKKLTLQAALARFARTMGTLGEGGLTVVDGLVLSKGVMGNYLLESIMDSAQKHIHEGSSLSHELKKEPLIPKFVSRMLAVGEETGNTTAMWLQIAELYEEEVEKAVERLMALAQPVILIIMGVIVGSVLLAILIPLTDISSFGS
jgi:general secretion pathway protein F